LDYPLDSFASSDDENCVIPARSRCPWCKVDDPLYLSYHDEEWGVADYDGGHLFEMLALEGAQAGLSWRTVLRKRAHYRKVFCGFDPHALSQWTDAEIANALRDPGIIRNRQKVDSVINNARVLMTQFGGDPDRFATFLWAAVDGKPIQHAFQSMGDVPARDPASDRLSAELRRRGFRFVGSTICYAFMQAVGMVNDHLVTCFRYDEVRRPG